MNHDTSYLDELKELQPIYVYELIFKDKPANIKFYDMRNRLLVEFGLVEPDKGHKDSTTISIIYHRDAGGHYGQKVAIKKVKYYEGFQKFVVLATYDNKPIELVAEEITFLRKPYFRFKPTIEPPPPTKIFLHSC